MTTTTRTASPPIQPRRPPAGATLAIVMLAIVALPMSLTGVSVALPEIGRDLGAGAEAQQWAVTGFNVAFASLMLAFGSLGDLVGRRRLFQGGTALFAAGQLVAALAPTILVLDLGRIAAGVGAAAALPAGSALLAARFDGAARARAFGLFGTVLGAGLSLGPVLGGLVADQLSWRALLLLLTVLGGTAAVLAPFLLEESRDPEGERVDWWGTATFTSALALGILGIIGAPEAGWLAPRTLLLAGVSASLLVAFVFIERRQERPMLDLTLLRQPRFLGLGVAAMAIVIAFVPLLVNLPTLFMQLRGVSSSEAGLIVLFLTGPILVVPVLAGSLKERIDVRFLVWTGLILEAVGVAWLTTTPPEGGLVAIALPLVVAGTGIGIANGILDGAAISAVPPARAGMAAGLFNTMRLGAETTAIAVAGSLLVTWTQGAAAGGTLPAGATPEVVAQKVTQGDIAGLVSGAPEAAQRALTTVAEQSYVTAFHHALWVLAAVCALALVATGVLLHGFVEEPADDVAMQAPSPAGALEAAAAADAAHERTGAVVVSSEACSTTVA